MIELRDLEKAELKPGKYYAVFVDCERLEEMNSQLQRIAGYVGCTFLTFDKDIEIREIEKKRCGTCNDFIDECYCPENENVKRT